jgi:hypothetical protein
MTSWKWRALATGALLAVAVATGPASADPTPAPHSTLGRPTTGPAASPDVLGSGNLVNHGGHVESTATNYLIFWGLPALPQEYTCGGAGCTVFDTLPRNLNLDDAVPYAAAIEHFFQTVGGTPFYGMLGQYGVSNATDLGGVYSDVTAPPTGKVSTAAIEAEVRKAEAANGWTGGIGHNFWVLFGPSAVPCASDGSCAYTDFCGYHWTMSDRGGLETPYAVIPYPDGACDYAATGAVSQPNLVPESDAALNVISHELFETVTDPGVGQGDYGWYDSAGYEIADKCAWIFGASTVNGGDVTLHGHPYMLQLEYSNSGSHCTLS